MTQYHRVIPDSWLERLREWARRHRPIVVIPGLAGEQLAREATTYLKQQTGKS